MVTIKWYLKYLDLKVKYGELERKYYELVDYVDNEFWDIDEVLSE